MSGSVMVAIITVSGSIVVAALTFLLTKWYERRADWQKRKLEHYTELLSSLSDLAVDGRNKDRANLQFSHAVNTIGLVAPQYVIGALMAYHAHVRFSNLDRSAETHDQLLRRLLLAIRKDISRGCCLVMHECHITYEGRNSSHSERSRGICFALKTRDSRILRFKADSSASSE